MGGWVSDWALPSFPSRHAPPNPMSEEPPCIYCYVFLVVAHFLSLAFSPAHTHACSYLFRFVCRIFVSFVALLSLSFGLCSLCAVLGSSNVNHVHAILQLSNLRT